MDKSKKKVIFFTIFAIVITGVGVGGYFLYDYTKRKKADATTVSLEDARSMVAALDN